MAPILSVVIPVHNEADFLATGLGGLLDAIEQVAVATEIIVVENGSTDGTADVARDLLPESAGRVLSLPQPDYGAAMRHGFLQARGDWIVNVDIDYYSATFFRSVIDAGPDADVVIGSKRDPASEDRRTWVRRAGTRVFNLLLRLLFRSRVTDTHGMKGFRRQPIIPLVEQVVSRQDLFDTELVLRAERAGLGIMEVPVVVEEMRPARSSFLKRVPRTIRGLWRIRRVLPPA